MNEVLRLAMGTGSLFGVSSEFSLGHLLVLLISETLRYGIRTGIIFAMIPMLTFLPVMVAGVIILNQFTRLDFLLGVISFAGTLFFKCIEWLSLKTVGLDPGVGKMKLNSLLTYMTTNYLNSLVYLSWFAVVVPFILKSGKVFGGPAALFMLPFFSSITGAKFTLVVITRLSWELLRGLWNRRVMQLLGLSLISYALLHIKEGIAIIGVV